MNVLPALAIVAIGLPHFRGKPDKEIKAAYPKIAAQERLQGSVILVRDMAANKLVVTCTPGFILTEAAEKIVQIELAAKGKVVDEVSVDFAIPKPTLTKKGKCSVPPSIIRENGKGVWLIFVYADTCPAAGP